MRTVSARDANQQFSKILEAAVQGEEVTITRRGVPVARLVAVNGEADAAAAAERERRVEEILAGFDEGYGNGPSVPWTRDEIYEDRLKRFFDE